MKCPCPVQVVGRQLKIRTVEFGLKTAISVRRLSGVENALKDMHMGTVVSEFMMDVLL